jgi:hypothetical protein
VCFLGDEEKDGRDRQSKQRDEERRKERLNQVFLPLMLVQIRFLKSKVSMDCFLRHRCSC